MKIQANATHRLRPTFAVLTTLLSASCLHQQKSFSTAENSSAHRDLKSFTELEISGAFNVEYVQGTQSSCDIRTDSALLHKIETTVDGNTLHISLRSNNTPTNGATIVVTSPHLESIETHGSVDARISNIAGPHFRAEMNGSGELVLSGTTNHLEIETHDASIINARKLSAQTAKVDISGSSNVDITVQENLEASVHGSGNVRYYGSPKISTDLAGSGSVEAGT